MNVTFTRDELKEVLQLTEYGYKAVVKRKQLEDRLLEYGYKLEKQYKDGRCTIYEVSIVNTNEWIDLQNRYRIKKKEEHSIYSKARITNGDSSRAKLIRDNDIHITQTTAKKFDLILCKEDIIAYDSKVYYILEKKTGDMIEITEQEYKEFWYNNMTARNAIEQVNRQIDSKEITREIGDIYKHRILEKLDNKDGFIAVQFNTYKQASNAEKFLKLIDSL